MSKKTLFYRYEKSDTGKKNLYDYTRCSALRIINSHNTSLGTALSGSQTETVLFKPAPLQRKRHFETAAA
jgi:hypothetical protein